MGDQSPIRGLASWPSLAVLLTIVASVLYVKENLVSQRPQRLGDIPKRLAAVRAFSTLPEAAALAAANKRVGNILKKVENTVEAWVDAALLKEAAEIALHAALVDVVPRADAAFVTGDYTESLQALAALRAPVDAFFDDVMVNVEDPTIRSNRLGLLAKLRKARAGQSHVQPGATDDQVIEAALDLLIAQQEKRRASVPPKVHPSAF